MGKFSISTTFNTNRGFLYKVFMDSDLHSRITGSKAEVDNRIGGKFTAWDGYITGKTIDLKKDEKIVQAWRTSDFTKESKDSILEITLTEVAKNKTRLTLNHKDLPEGSEQEYKNGWQDYYIAPIREYLKNNANDK